MNNVEKAKEIAEKSQEYFYHNQKECGLACALRMAKWKDEQFEKLVSDYIELAYNNGESANLLEDLLKEI